jgi:hypothetical protein
MAKQKEQPDVVFTMDDIARRFLSAAPKPDRKAPKKKSKPRKRGKAKP